MTTFSDFLETHVVDSVTGHDEPTGDVRVDQQTGQAIALHLIGQLRGGVTPYLLNAIVPMFAGRTDGVAVGFFYELAATIAGREHGPMDEFVMWPEPENDNASPRWH